MNVIYYSMRIIILAEKLKILDDLIKFEAEINTKKTDYGQNIIKTNGEVGGYIYFYY